MKHAGHLPRFAPGRLPVDIRDHLLSVRGAMEAYYPTANIDAAAKSEASAALDVLERFARQIEGARSGGGQGLRVNKGDRALATVGGTSFVAIVGINSFNALRDEFGGTVVDTILGQVFKVIEEVTAVTRFGRVNSSSLEFCFDALDMEAAEQVLLALHQRLEAPIHFAGRRLCLDITIGFTEQDCDDDVSTDVDMAAHDIKGRDVARLVDRVEQALARARTSHTKVAGYTAADRKARSERISLMRDLRGVTQSGALHLCYQPKLDIRESTVSSVEALVRWTCPERGPVSPEQFISLAEEGGEIRPLTEFVITRALIDQQIMAQAHHSVTVFVNISGQLIAKTDFIDWILTTMGDRTDRLGFEITETAVIANPEMALKNLKRLVDHGVRIAIDDYGVGLSSLSYLKQIPAHELKIDRSFLTSLTTSHIDPLLVRSTIDLAHALGMKVTAEGIESGLSLALLRVMGCDMAQGYHISKALALEELINFLNNAKSDSTARNTFTGEAATA